MTSIAFIIIQYMIKEDSSPLVISMFEITFPNCVVSLTNAPQRNANSPTTLTNEFTIHKILKQNVVPEKIVKKVFVVSIMIRNIEEIPNGRL